MRAPRQPRRFDLASIFRRWSVPLMIAVVLLTAGGAFLATTYAAWANDATVGGLAPDGTSSSTDETMANSDTQTTPTETVPTEPVPTEPVPTEPATTTEEQPPPPPETGGGEVTATEASPPAEPPPAVTVIDPGPPIGQLPPGSDSSPTPVITLKHKNRPLETEEGGHAIVWLHRWLPDPTPPAKRLAPSFARNLREISQAAHVRWWLVLAVIRARGGDGRVPVRVAVVERLVHKLALLHARRHPARAISTLARHDTEFTGEVMALARYNRAVGLRALVRGLESAKTRLERRILTDRRIDIYPAGRWDIALHRIDVRVLVLVRYLRVTFKQVTISSLFSGHRYFARPGVVSAHMYGLAVDIGALAGTPISGHQQPGGLTDRAVASILQLPSEVQPQQIISLLGLGGPSFPLADHHDHIHIGY
jgi:hypothetical protein